MSIPGNNLLAQYYAQNQGLPDSYEAVEYLESTGTQYIDTGFIFRGGVLKTVMDCDGIVQSPEHAIIGNYTNGYMASSVFGIYSGNWYLYTRCNPNASDGNLTVPVVSGKHHIEFTLDTGNHHRELHVDDSVVSSDVYFFDSAKASAELFVFAGGARGYVGGKYKLWELAFVDNNINRRDFIPCVRKADSKPGLYDLCKSICPLTGTPFYINSGTGEFVTP